MTCEALAAAAFANKGEIVPSPNFERYVFHKLDGRQPAYRNTEILDPTNPIIGCVYCH